MSSPENRQADSLANFRNEPYTDFSVPANRQAMEAALRSVRGQFGREYDLWIDGKAAKGGGTFNSRNPSRPSEIVGVHQAATAAQAAEAVESAYRSYPGWSSVPAAER